MENETSKKLHEIIELKRVVNTKVVINCEHCGYHISAQELLKIYGPEGVYEFAQELLKAVEMDVVLDDES